MLKHPFHLVDIRPWPITGSLGVIYLFTGILSVWLKIENKLVTLGAAIIILTVWQWWRDVRREATIQGKHTTKVEIGLRYGILLFILREVCFFFAFFWAFFHSSLSPRTDLGLNWPPYGIVAIKPYDVPLLNTVVLLSRGCTITWAHIALLNSLWLEATLSTSCTVLLGLLFTLLQVYEFKNRVFALADCVYGSTFYLLSGFHGLHVVVGTLFIASICARHWHNHFTKTHHFGFEARAWYWHFVDVVWLILFLRVYWWGSQ